MSSNARDIPLSIIIPVYNEGNNIYKCFQEIKKKINTEHKIYIIFDFDEDNTIPVVKRFIQETKSKNISLIKNKYQRGVLNAIKTGFEIIPQGAILLMMADLSDDLKIVDQMYQKILQGYHLICGSRYMKKGRQINGPLFKKGLSRLAGLSLHVLTGIPVHDITNSFKMYTKEVLNNIAIISDGGFELGMEIVVKSYLKGFKVSELPSIWRDRYEGESNFKLWQWLPKYLKWYFYLIRNRWFRLFI